MNFKFVLGLSGVILFSLTGHAAPSISSFTPNYGASNDPTYITITGSGFFPGTLVVKFNGVQDPAAFATLANGTEIQAHVAAGTPKGTGYVFVSVNGAQAPTNNGVLFTVIGPSDPYVETFSPTTGIPGSTPVTLTGTHFTGMTALRFNGVNAAFSVTDDSSITVTVPAGTTTGPISAVRSGSSTNTTSALFYVAPAITNFVPASGRAGTNVVIRGTSFTGATVVKFGSLSANFTVDSNAQITAVAPIGVVSGTIRVEAPGGTNITSSSFLVLPTVSSFTPGFGPVGASVTVSGANFTGTTSVKFGGIAASFSGVSAGSLTAVVPAGATNAPISVTTADGTGTSPQTFYVSAAVTSFTPNNSAPGSTVKITGNNFTGATAVSFNGTSAASFVISNNTTIGAVVPGGVSTGPISVTTPAGTANSGGLFYAAPVISGFAPTHGAPGTSVMISGNNFLGATAVLFNGSNAVFTVTNNGVIGATVPNNAPTGPLTVIAPGGTNTSAGTFTVDYTSDISVFITNAPNPVFVTSNLVYTITVANYVGPNDAFNVKLTNTLPASVTLKSAATTQGTLNTNANPITATLGTIPVGNSAIITLTVVPQTVGTITDTASAGSDNSDPNLANNSASNVTTVWPLAVLGIQTLTSNQVKVFWPAPLSNFTLLTKSNLLPLNAAWSTDLTARVISGTNISVTEINSNAAKFFRLKQ